VLINPTRSALLSLLAATALVGPATLLGSAPAEATTTRETRMVEKINHTRANHGLPPLRVSPDLAAAAHAHSVSMAGQGMLFHTASLTSFCCWDVIAENVGAGFTIRGVHRSFLRSAPHRANILDRRMQQVGMGIVSVGGRLWVTEVFRNPSR
jgi:uncharacterized protein YkwD